MPPTAITRVLLGATIVLAAVGAVESLRLSAAELALMFAVVGVLAAVQWVRLLVGRPPLPLRADLVRWITERAQLTGEDPGRIADRAIASYRAALGEAPADTEAGEQGRQR